MLSQILLFLTFLTPQFKLSSDKNIYLKGKGPPLIFSTGLFGAKSGIPEMEDITMYIQFSPGTYFWIIFFSITTILIIAMGVAYYKAKNKHGIKR